jgi:hypothetical protein
MNMLRRRIYQVLLGAIVGVCLLILPGISSAQGNSDEAFARVKEVQERHSNELMAKPGVAGTAIGPGQSAQPVVLVLVEHGGVSDLPGDLEGIPVRPLVTGKIYALPKGGQPAAESTLSPTARWPRPVPIGVSTGNPSVTAGTIGCRVTDGTNVYALSNNHVYASQNLATIGTAVLQPGIYDGGTSPTDNIGTLFAFEPIVMSTSANNVIDAAIAQSTTALLGKATPPDGYGLPKSTTATVKFGAKVMKYGRTTGQTSGIIQGTNTIVNVTYDVGVARFVGQLLIGGGSFSAGGDSGSLIVLSGKGSNARKPVGLLFAGGSGFTVANPIDAVLKRFGVTVDGE